MKIKILSSNFIFNYINKNINNLNYKCNTRFAPEASGYLHIGHVKNIIVNYDVSKIYNGIFNIRIDDTNPKKNKKKFIKYIKENIKWILKKVSNKKIQKIYYSSNHFHKLYQYLEYFKKFFFKKKIKIIRKIKNGYFKEKNKIIINEKYKIILYRIIIKKHVKTNYNWFIYPMYDWSNTLCDKIENIKYSICSIEFSKNKNIYNFISKIIYEKITTKQIEFSRLIIKNNVTKKRIISFLLKNKYIKNHKDPRLLTINSLINQGINQNIIYSFLKNLSLSRKQSIINNKFFIKKILSLINFKNYNIIEEYIMIFIINFNKNIKFIINNKSYFFSPLLILKKNIFINNILKIFFLKNLKKKIILKNLKNIVCKNYKKNKYGFIKNIFCKFIKKKNKLINIYNNNINSKFKIKKIFKNVNNWINYKYKIKIFIFIKKEILKNLNKIFFNYKSFKKIIFYSENLMINNVNNFYKYNKEEYIFYKKFNKINKNNKIEFLYLN